MNLKKLFVKLVGSVNFCKEIKMLAINGVYWVEQRQRFYTLLLVIKMKLGIATTGKIIIKISLQFNIYNKKRQQSLGCLVYVKQAWLSKTQDVAMSRKTHCYSCYYFIFNNSTKLSTVQK